MIEPLLEAERAMTVGMLDHAERLYRAVAEADPRNSIAVVGLARVALERGQDVEALELSRRALRIDPDNVAAQRLVMRLEEVLRVRGVEVPEAAEANGMPGVEETTAGAASAESTRVGAEPTGESSAAPAEPTTSPTPPAPPPASPPRPSLLARLLRRD